MFFNGFVGQLIAGAKITIWITIFSIGVGILVGLLFMVGEMSKKILCNSITLVTAFIRGVPELLVIFIIYFGGTILLSRVFGTYREVNGFISGVIALGIIYGSYASQILRGAFLMIQKGQIESSKALGLSKFIIFRDILFPQIFRYAFPGLSNLCLVTLKDSSLVSLIGLQDLMFNTQLAADASYKPFTFYSLSALIYLFLTSLFEVSCKIIAGRNKYEF